MPRVTVEQLVAVQAHFGHLTSKWNPRMKPYIFTKRNGIHIIDLMKTSDMIDRACEAVLQIVAAGDQVLFVGTKKQAKELVKEQAIRCNSPYVCERWLGGTLTNLQTIRKSVKTMQLIEKQKIDGTYEKITKKERLFKDTQLDKLLNALGGIRDMRKLPGALFVVDIRNEEIAVAEATRLGIPVIGIVDTNSDPTSVKYPIPANDDAFKSIWLIMQAIANAVIEGQAVYAERNQGREQEIAEASANEEKQHREPRERGDRGERGGGGGGDRPRGPRRRDRGTPAEKPSGAATTE
ncbi:MAG: 30S ribosomal protein S2 [bacterium]|nr:30S ribosomal protein S2 [bacterium]